MTISPALFPAVTVTVVRDRKIRTALRTNQIAGFVTVPLLQLYYIMLILYMWKKIIIFIAYLTYFICVLPFLTFEIIFTVS